MKYQQMKQTEKVKEKKYGISGCCSMFVDKKTHTHTICKFIHSNNKNTESTIVGLMSCLFCISIVWICSEFPFDCLSNWPKKNGWRWENNNKHHKNGRNMLDFLSVFWVVENRSENVKCLISLCV